MGSFKPEYYSDYEQLSLAASELIVNRISRRTNVLLGIATGNSPLKTYQLIAKHLRSHPNLRERIQIFQLDEWLGLASQSENSCQYYVQKNIVEPWQLDEEKCFLLEGDALEQQGQLNRMKNYLDRQPIDLCILGLGSNGHLALNEPGSLITDPSRIVELSAMSQSHPMLEDLNHEVSKGITIGLKEILDAKEILLIISGRNKAEVTRQLLSEKINSNLPARALIHHPNWHCYIDKNVLI